VKEYGVILMKDFKPINFLRFNTEKETEKAYQENKSQGFGVVKVKIEKAFELQAVTFKNTPDTYQIASFE
jgi:hypothetical protein